MPAKQLLGSTTQDVMRHMRDMIIAESQSDDVLELLEYANEQEYNTDQALEFAARYFHAVAPFAPDPKGIQNLKTINRLVRDGAANCVQYTIALGAVAYALGYPVQIKVVAFEKPNQWQHVYPVINGLPMDLVLGQKQDGTERLFRTEESEPILFEEKTYISSAITEV